VRALTLALARSSDIERVLSHYDAEHVVESIVELRLAGGKGL